VVPARDAAATLRTVYLRTLRAVWHYGRRYCRRHRAKTPLRYVAIIIWLYSALRGLQLAWEHTMIQLHPSPFQTCDFAARFPTWLPLDKWLPQVFVATGDCSVRQWEFLTLEMPQWLVGIFAAYLVVGVLVLIAQPLNEKARSVWPLRTIADKRSSGAFFACVDVGHIKVHIKYIL
jgi:hypothetical protein